MKTFPGSSGVGYEIHGLIEDLLPFRRSITGNGLRQTLARLQEVAPLEIREVASGTQVFDWTVPKEWNLMDAWVETQDGKRVIDLANSDLHVVGYSTPVHDTMPLEELRVHLHSLPEHPDWIPYKTSYYHPSWGFCLTNNDLQRLEDGLYTVKIDSTLEDGALTYGELALEGEVEDEILVSCHTCHPSMCNDNLSGVAVAATLARRLMEGRPRLSYRFLFIPGTIGALTWLAINEHRANRIKHGLVLAGVGDRGPLTYKRSRQGAAPVDRAAARVLAHHPGGGSIRPFEPHGYDERQYCSPGFDLPVGCLMRTPWGEYPEYHTSADDLSFVDPESLGDSFETCLRIFEVLQRDRTYLNRFPFGEPQLGRRGVYSQLGGKREVPGIERATLWVLNQSDGRRSLMDIAETSGLPFRTVADAAELLSEKGLISEARAEGPDG